MIKLLSALFLIQAIGNSNAFAISEDYLIGKGVVCSQVFGVIGNDAGIATGYSDDGKLILKTTGFNVINGKFYVTVAKANPKTCKIISELN